MATHITNNRPPFIKVVLHKLGLIDLHTKVNCWFCNQDSFILPGTRNTAEHWFCHLCENTNARDKNGDIIDPSPFQVKDTGSITIPPTENSKSNNNERTLCKDCQEGQTLIYNMMSDYIPEESDPLYKERCATADQKQSELHQRYKLCTLCQKLIDKVVAEQKEILKYQDINRTIMKSLNEKQVERRPSRKEYNTKGFIWITTHLSTLAFVLYVAFYPVTKNDDMNWNEMIENVNLDYLKDYITWDSIQYKLESFKASIMYPVTSDRINWQLFMGHSVILLSILNILSLKAIDWNYKVTIVIHEKVKNLKSYKALQLVLFFLRFLILLIVYLHINSIILYSITAIYFTILYLSLNLIKTKSGKEVSNSFIFEEPEEEFEPMDTTEEMSIVDTSIDDMTNIIDRLQTL